MRILLGSWPGYGHLLPMVPMIRAAQHGGHDVVVSPAPTCRPLIGRLGVAAHRSGHAGRVLRPDAGHATISELPPSSRLASRPVTCLARRRRPCP